MELELKYGSGVLPLHLPDAATMDVFEPGVMSPLEDVSAALHAALGNPIEAMPLEARPTPRSVGIAVPDETRPVPVKALLPVVLERLFAEAHAVAARAYPATAIEAEEIP